MKRSLNGLLEALVLGLAVPTLAMAVTMTSSDYSAAKTKASGASKTPRSRKSDKD